MLQCHQPDKQRNEYACWGVGQDGWKQQPTVVPRVVGQLVTDSLISVVCSVSSLSRLQVGCKCFKGCRFLWACARSLPVVTSGTASHIEGGREAEMGRAALLCSPCALSRTHAEPVSLTSGIVPAARAQRGPEGASQSSSSSIIHGSCS